MVRLAFPRAWEGHRRQSRLCQNCKTHGYAAAFVLTSGVIFHYRWLYDDIGFYATKISKQVTSTRPWFFWACIFGHGPYLNWIACLGPAWDHSLLNPSGQLCDHKIFDNNPSRHCSSHVQVLDITRLADICWHMPQIDGLNLKSFNIRVFSVQFRLKCMLAIDHI